jgi:hypothetical protein
MKFLCLAYGGEDDWKAMTKQEQSEVLSLLPCKQRW